LIQDPSACGEGFRSAQIGFHDFVAEAAMLARMAAQRAYFELAPVSPSAHNSASLMACCSDDGDHLIVDG
jgi:hypothetical protein